MLSLACGTIWALLVAGLLQRILRNFRSFKTASLDRVPAVRPCSSVAIVIPARDEATNIAACLAGVCAQEDPSDRLSIVVVDDDSRDATAAEVQRMAGLDTRIRLIRTGALPEGWLGKSHACWTGAMAAQADWLCFVDADVRLAPTLLSTAVATAESKRIDLLSVQPFQVLGSFWERLVISAGLLMIACAKRFPGADGTGDVAVSGQFMLVRAGVYRKLGGHSAVRADVCEDSALAHRLEQSDHVVRVMAGEHLAGARMYRDFASLWEGFAKNAVEIMGSARRTVLAALAGFVVGWAGALVPACLAIAALQTPDAPRLAGFVAAAIASCVVFAVQFGTLRHFGASWLLLPLFPLGISIAFVVVCDSVRLRRRGMIRWKGRIYRLQRIDPPPRRR